MKKFLTIIMLILLISPVYAKEYVVQDDVVSISLDDNWVIITKDNYKNNSSLKELGISEYYEKEFGKEFENNDVYFNALKSDKGNIIYDLLISYYEENRIKNYINYDEDFLCDDSKVLKKSFKEGQKILDNGIYINDNTKYIWVNYYYDQHYYQYYETVVNEKTYQIYMSSANKLDKNEIEKFRNNIIDNITFNIDLSLEEDNNQYEKTNFFEGFFDSFLEHFVFWFIPCVIIISILKFIDNKRKSKNNKHENDEFWE